MSPCDEYLELISARLDGELSPFEEKRLEAHLCECPACRQLADELAVDHELLADLPLVPVPDGLKDRITAAVASDNVTPMPKKSTRRWKGLLATAAVLALVIVGAGMSGLFDTSPVRPQYAPNAQNDQVVFTLGVGDEDAGLARTALDPVQDVLFFTAAQLFPEGKLTDRPVYDRERGILTLALEREGLVTLTCTQAQPEGLSTVELTWADGSVEVYSVDPVAETVTISE